MKTNVKSKGRKVSAATVWRFVKKNFTAEEIGAILKVIPASVATQALLTGNEQCLGEYILGPDLQAYLQAKSYQRKRIALRAIARIMQEVGLEVPASWVREGRQRGPRSDSKLSLCRNLLEQTYQLLYDESANQIRDYLLQVEAFLSAEIARIENLYRYAREYQTRKKQEQEA